MKGFYVYKIKGLFFGLNEIPYRDVMPNTHLYNSAVSTSRFGLSQTVPWPSELVTLFLCLSAVLCRWIILPRNSWHPVPTKFVTSHG
jgi:hypothetical protein